MVRNTEACLHKVPLEGQWSRDFPLAVVMSLLLGQCTQAAEACFLLTFLSSPPEHLAALQQTPVLPAALHLSLGPPISMLDGSAASQGFGIQTVSRKLCVSDLRSQTCEVWLERRGRANFLLRDTHHNQQSLTSLESCDSFWELSGLRMSMVLSFGYLKVRLLRLTVFPSTGFPVWFELMHQSQNAILKCLISFLL